MLKGAVKWRNEEASWPEHTENVHIQASFCCSVSTHTKAAHFASNVRSSFLTMLVCSKPFKSRQNWLVTYLIICHIPMSLIQTTGHKMAALTVTAVFLQLWNVNFEPTEGKNCVSSIYCLFKIPFILTGPMMFIFCCCCFCCYSQPERL